MTNGTYWWLLESQKSRQGMRSAPSCLRTRDRRGRGRGRSRSRRTRTCRATWHLPQQQLPRGPCSWVRIWSKLKVPQPLPNPLPLSLPLHSSDLATLGLGAGLATHLSSLLWYLVSARHPRDLARQRGVAACGHKLNYNNMLRFSSRKKRYLVRAAPPLSSRPPFP